MTHPELHPWLATPEALTAAQRAVAIPRALMGGKAAAIGYDELLSEALVVLTECAQPQRDAPRGGCERCGKSLENVRAGAKFCSPNCRKQHAVAVGRKKAEVIPAKAGSHVGAMWNWPETERMKYAIREVGYALNNHLRTRSHIFVEQSSSDTLTRMDVADLTTTETEETPYALIVGYLESKGLVVVGDETLEELAEAAQSAFKVALS